MIPINYKYKTLWFDITYLFPRFQQLLIYQYPSYGDADADDADDADEDDIPVFNLPQPLHDAWICLW